MSNTSHATHSMIRARLAHPAGRGLVQGRLSHRSRSGVEGSGSAGVALGARARAEEK